MADASLVELWAFSVMDTNGEPIEGAKLNTYEAGTVDTALATFKDEDLVTPNPNPVLTDAAGRFPDPVYAQNKQYKFVLTDASDNVLQTIPVWQPLSLLDPVATNAAMKALDVGLLTEGLDIYVDDRATAGDGGGGNWYATESNPGADNDGTILHSDTVGWYFVRKNAETLNPEWFGAAHDGATNDSAAIQATLDVWVSDAFSHLIFPPGNYLCTTGVAATFTVNDTKGKTISGYGANIGSNLASGNLLTITAQALVRNLTINGLRLSGGASETALVKLDGGDGTALESLYSCNFNDMHLEGSSGHGWHVVNDMFESKWSGCSVRQSGASTGEHCMFFEDGAFGTISSIILDGVITSGGDIGVYVASPVSDLQIQGGTYILAERWGVLVDNAIGSTVSQAHFENNWESAASIATGGAGLKLTGSGQVSGVYGTTARNQRYVVEFFVSANKVCTVTGGRSAGSTVNYVKIGGTSGANAGTVNIIGTQTYDKTVADITVRQQGADGFEFEAGGPSLKAGSGDPEGVVTAPVGSKYLRSGGTAPSYSKLTGTGDTGWKADPLRPVATQLPSTSGTTVDFEDITAGVEQIQIIFDGVSLTSSDELLIQLGSGAGPTYKATGYEGAAASSGAALSVTTAFSITVSSGAVDTWSGIAHLEKMSDNVWVINGTIAEDSNTSGMSMFAGKLDLAAELTAIRALNNGASTFDLGRIATRILE